MAKVAGVRIDVNKTLRADISKIKEGISTHQKYTAAGGLKKLRKRSQTDLQ